MSFSGLESVLGTTYSYMNQLQNPYISNYNLVSGLYGTGYTNLLSTNTTENLDTFAKVLEKLSKECEQLNTNKVENKTERVEEQALESNTSQTAVKRNKYRMATNVTTRMGCMKYKKINPYVSISCSKKI